MLMCAASSGHAMLVSRLISANASVTVSDNNGCASLHIACFAAATAWASMRDPSCMREPVVRMDESCMQTLLDHKAALEQQDHAGLTPLMIASQADCAPVVSFLLRAGASLDTLDINGHSALWHADAQGHRALAKMLRRKQMSAAPHSSTDRRIAAAAAAAAAEAAAECLLAETERERETAAHRAQRRRERKAARPKKAGGSSMGSSMGSNGSSSTEAGDLSSLDYSSIEGSLVGPPERQRSRASTSCEGPFRHASHCGSTCESSFGADTSCEGSFRQGSHCGSTCESSTCGCGGWEGHSLDAMTSGSSAAIDHNTISHECTLASLTISSASASATTTSPPACAQANSPPSVVHMATAVGSANSAPSERRPVDIDLRAEWRLPPPLSQPPSPPSPPPPSIITPESPVAAAAHGNAPAAVYSTSNGIGVRGATQASSSSPAGLSLPNRYSLAPDQLGDAATSTDGPTEGREAIELPSQLLCPITMALMHQPTMTADGFTYEQSAIEDWFVKRNTSPITGAHLDTTILLPNMMARSMVHEFVDRYPGLPECIAFRQKQSGS